MFTLQQQQEHRKERNPLVEAAHSAGAPRATSISVLEELAASWNQALLREIARLHEKHDGQGNQGFSSRDLVRDLKASRTLRLEKVRRDRPEEDVSDSSGVDESELKDARWRSKDQRRKLVRKAMSEVYRMQIRDPTLLRTQPLQPRSAFPPKIDTGCLTDGQATISRQPSGAVATRIENRHDAAPQDADSCFKSGLELQQRGNVQGAYSLLMKAAALNPQNPRYHMALGDLLMAVDSGWTQTASGATGNLNLKLGVRVPVPARTGAGLLARAVVHLKAAQLLLEQTSTGAADSVEESGLGELSMMLGRSYEGLGRLDLALAAYSRVERGSAAGESALLAKARCLLGAGNEEGASAAVEQMLAPGSLGSRQPGHHHHHHHPGLGLRYGLGPSGLSHAAGESAPGGARDRLGNSEWGALRYAPESASCRPRDNFDVGRHEGLELEHAAAGIVHAQTVTACFSPATRTRRQLGGGGFKERGSGVGLGPLMLPRTSAVAPTRTPVPPIPLHNLKLR